MNEVLSGGTDFLYGRTRTRNFAKIQQCNGAGGIGGERRKFAPSNSKSMNEDTSSGA